MEKFGFVIVILTALLVCIDGCSLYSYPGQNWCRYQCTRRLTRSVSYTEYYSSYTRCGNIFNRRRCHRTRSRTRYRTEYYTEYYYQDQCCSGYVQHNGLCKLNPSITNPSNTVRKVCIEGDTVLLCCTAVGSPRPAITWSRGPDSSRAIRTSTQGSVESTSCITITNIRRFDSSYHCNARNSRALRRRFFYLTVKYCNLYIERSLHYWEKSSSTVPVCVIMSQYAGGCGSSAHGLKFAVSRNGRTVKTGYMLLSSSIQRQCSDIKIPKSYRSPGDFRITISKLPSSNGTITRSSATIRPRLYSPSITNPSANVNMKFNEGDTALLSCTARGLPRPVITWSPNSGTISTTKCTDEQGFEVITSSISIANIQRNVLPYTCNARNTLGQIRRSFSLTANYSILQIEKSLHYWEKDNSTVPVCVKIYQTNVPINGTGYVHGLNFIVSRNGYSVKTGYMLLSSSVRRQCSDILIPESYRSQGDLTVSISKLFSSDYGTISRSSAIIRPRQYSPSITNPSANVNMKFNEGDTALLSCTARGLPRPVITWSPNSGTISTTKCTDEQGFEVITSSISIANIQRNVLSYTCNARNTQGQIRRSFSLTANYSVLQIEKYLHYWENDNCTVPVCVKIYQTNVPINGTGYVHGLNFIVSRNGYSVKTGYMLLSSSVRRQCTDILIPESYRSQGDLTVSISKLFSSDYGTLSRSSAIIRPRQYVVIGFERDEVAVYESAGRVKICVRIIKPSYTSKLESVYYYLRLSVISNSSVSPYDYYASISSYFVLYKYYTRRCWSISIIHDHIHEDNEKFQLVLSGSSLPYYVSISPAVSNVTIINVKKNFSLGFDMAKIKVHENAGSVSVCITSSISNFRNGHVTLQVVIPMCHENDLSLSDSLVDFEGTGNNRQCLTLNITDDNDVEGNEEVTLILEIVNTTEPFYMDIKPSSMIVEIVDDDSITCGFNTSVVEVEKGSPVSVCVSCSKVWVGVRPLLLYATPTQGTADRRSYVSFGGIYSSSYPDGDCYTSYTWPHATFDDQPKMFSMALASPFSQQDVILDPSTVVIKITNKGTNPCTSGNYTCEDGCPSNWTVTSINLTVSKDLCLSEQAVIKYRDATNGCSSKGLFCIETIEEKLVHSFQLGISPQLHTPESAEGSCSSRNPNPLNCSTTRPPPSIVCNSTRPSVCQKRSVLVVLDMSSSIGPQNFQMMADGIAELIQHFCGDIQLAVAKFNQYAYVDRCFNCPASSRFELSSFIRSVSNESRGSNGNNFNSAVCINEEVFSSSCGNHSQSDCIDIIYVTDGGFSGSSCGHVKMSLTNQHGICSKSKIFAIGIGKSVRGNELKCIASAASEDIETTFQFDSFIDFRKYVCKTIQYLYKKKKECKLRSGSGSCESNRIDLACRD